MRASPGSMAWSVRTPARLLAAGGLSEAEDGEFCPPGQCGHDEGIEGRDDHVGQQHDHAGVDGQVFWAISR